jgi:hypothetical protein
MNFSEILERVASKRRNQKMLAFSELPHNLLQVQTMLLCQLGHASFGIYERNYGLDMVFDLLSAKLYQKPG